LIKTGAFQAKKPLGLSKRLVKKGIHVSAIEAVLVVRVCFHCGSIIVLISCSALSALVVEDGFAAILFFSSGGEVNGFVVNAEFQGAYASPMLKETE